MVTLQPGPACRVTTSGPFAPTSRRRTCWSGRCRCCARPIRSCVLGAVELEKNLPVAAGLGGGSADAAALLRAVRAPIRARRTVDWHGLAARLGADVPVCLAGVPAGLIRGIGDRRAVGSPIAHLPGANAVSGQSAPAPADGASLRSARRVSPLPASFTGEEDRRVHPGASTSLDASSHYMQARGNDLEAPRQSRSCPSSPTSRRRSRRSPDAGMAAMSGSGPTCFGIFGDDA